MIVFALVVAAATLVAGLGAATVLARLPSLSLRLAGLALLGVVLPLAAVLLSGVVMFSSGHDLAILAVAAGSSTAALAAALFVARSIHGAIDRVRMAASAVAGGDLEARAPENGPAEVAELAASFNEMAANVEGLFDARRQLVAWASHDLRTPLANMQAMLEALEDGLAGPDRYLPALREQARTLGRLVDDLFELARIDAGALTLELRDAPLAALVQSCLRGLEAEARARRVTRAAEMEGPDSTVRCAPEKVCGPARRAAEAWSHNRPRSRRGPGRAHLGREPARRRCSRLVHAAARRHVGLTPWRKRIHQLVRASQSSRKTPPVSWRRRRSGQGGKHDGLAYHHPRRARPRCRPLGLRR